MAGWSCGQEGETKREREREKKWKRRESDGGLEGGTAGKVTVVEA